jgi:hypothetical protein
VPDGFDQEMASERGAGVVELRLVGRSMSVSAYTEAEIGEQPYKLQAETARE